MQRELRALDGLSSIIWAMSMVCGEIPHDDYRSGRSPLSNTPIEESNKLSKRVAKTYHAHLEMAKRLQRRDRNWTTALVVSASASTVAAVALLGAPRLYGDRGPVLWALMGVVTLVISLVVANADYKVRSLAAVTDYRKLHRLWSEIHYSSLEQANSADRALQTQARDADYQKLLDLMPNHSAADYYSVMALLPATHECIDEHEWSHLPVRLGERYRIYAVRLASLALTCLPVVVSLVSVCTIIPVVEWLVSG